MRETRRITHEVYTGDEEGAEDGEERYVHERAPEGVALEVVP